MRKKIIAAQALNKKRAGQSGVITVEAALLLPFLICAIVTLGLFVRVYDTYQRVQHGLGETAYEIGSTAYLYHSLGLYELQTGAEAGLESAAVHGETRVEAVKQTLQLAEETLEALGGDLETLLEKGESLVNRATGLVETGKEIIQNPLYEMKSLLALLGQEAYESEKARLTDQLVKVLLKKHLVSGDWENEEKALQSLLVVGGLEGMDFTKSSFDHEKGMLTLIGSYQVKLPLPFQFVESIPLVHQVTLRPWIKGDQGSANSDGEGTTQAGAQREAVDQVVEAGYDIWALPVWERGRNIKNLLGRTLEPSFPRVDSLEAGNLIAIRTHDTRLQSNQGSSFFRQMRNEVNELEAFVEATYQGVTVGPGQYSQKSLHVVIPDVELTQEQLQAIENAKTYGASKNVTVKIIVVK